MKRIDEATVNAIAAYTGPVTPCPPGKARGPEPVRKPNEAARLLQRHHGDPRVVDPHRRRRVELARQAARWLDEHRSDPPVIDPKAVRRRRRGERARRERIAARNTAILRQGQR
jgi:hypothetical protein